MSQTVKGNKKTQTAECKKTILADLSQVEQVCSIFRILADQTRMRIVVALMEGSLCVGQIMQACDCTQSGVSHQLRILRDNKIVSAKRHGQSVEYAIADQHVRKIVEMGLEHLHCTNDEV